MAYLPQILNMKFQTLLLLIVGSLFQFSLLAQNAKELISKPEIKDVLLFTNGANVKSVKRENVSSGNQTVTFKGISNHIDPNSVQVKCEGDVTILSVNYAISYLNPMEAQKMDQLIKDSIQSVATDIQRLEVQVSAIKIEESILNSNLKVSGENTGLSTAEMEKLITIATKRLTDCGLRNIELRNQIVKKQETLTRLRQQLGGQMREQPSGEIKVVLKSEKSQDIKFEISYYVSNCGWEPLYDVRAKDVSSPLEIIAKANVYQMTGEDWKNVSLHLSTGNPAQGGIKPELQPWFANVAAEYVRKTAVKSRYRIAESNNDNAGFAPSSERSLSEVQIVSAPKKNKTVQDFTTINTENVTNAVYDINLPFTIKSNGERSLVEIQHYEMKAHYSYSVAPKLDADVFLMAGMIGWDKSELISGEASIFFENTYVGKSYFDTKNTEDTIKFSLGRDNNISVKRTLLKEFKETVGVNQSPKITRTFEIEIRNKRKQAIELLVEDQIPISQNEQLEINLIDSGNAQFTKEDGKLSWKLKLEPAQQNKLKYSYSAKYPKKMVLVNF